MRSAWAVETQDLVVMYGVVTAVDQVTLRVAPGEIYGRVVPKERVARREPSIR